jgi:arsenical-resistance protein 2
MSVPKSTKSTELPWYDAYPQPSTKTPAQVSRDEVLAWIKQGQRPGRDFLVVDVRKLDHTVCIICPPDTFYVR